MKEFGKQGKTEPLLWDTDYDGSAIYALVDENGKRYIGRASHLQRRLKAHRSAFRKILKSTPEQLEQRYLSEGKKIVEALFNGTVFHAEILKSFPEVYEASHNELAQWETHFLKEYGGQEQTYNGTCATTPNPQYEPYNKRITWEEYDDLVRSSRETLDKCDKAKPKPKRRISVSMWMDEEEADIFDKLTSVPDRAKYIKTLVKKDIEKEVG